MGCHEETGGEDMTWEKYKKENLSNEYVFGNQCSNCGRVLHRNSKSKVGYLCRVCGPSFNTHYDSNKHACYNCQFEPDCSARVQLGVWVRCENPDVADLERLRYSGGLDDEEVRTELDKSLARRGNRKVLEKAVSKSAQKIYQMLIEGSKRQAAYRFRE
jgi:hypothetical protein